VVLVSLCYELSPCCGVSPCFEVSLGFRASRCFKVSLYCKASVCSQRFNVSLCLMFLQYSFGVSLRFRVSQCYEESLIVLEFLSALKFVFLSILGFLILTCYFCTEFPCVGCSTCANFPLYRAPL
jgi:hypothetical protein